MAFFAVQVRTGKELKAKEMILHIFRHARYQEANLLKAIYALECYTKYVSHKTDHHIDFPDLEEKDINNTLKLDTLNDNLSNLRKQYDNLKSYKDKPSTNMKKTLHQKITKLVHYIKAIRKKSEKIKVTMPGYILIELKTESLYLPNILWQLINHCPAVISIPSQYSIPKEEVNNFFNTTIEPEIEIEFEVVMDYQEILNRKKELVHAANHAGIEEEKSILQAFDELEHSIVSEVEDLKESGKTIMDKIRAFIKNKKEKVTLPVSLFNKLYNQYDNVSAAPLTQTFMNQLRLMIANHTVALE